MRKLKLYMPLLLTMTALSGCMANRALSNQPRQECYDLDDCGEESVCFLGGCVAAEGGGLSTVYAHITPPNDSTYLPQEIPGAVNLDSSLQVDWTLEEAITLAGSLNSANTAVEGGRIKASYQSTIPGREGALHQTMIDDGSFSLKLIPGTYTCTFEPDQVSNLPAMTLESNS
ncbi:MAG: hypothetical protein QGI45_07030, partial [Myxococcota bacterium]|nr:hypothetical protein [Myxococcota bacterium]